jgi:predicted PP-loop superfamily ATPase
MGLGAKFLLRFLPQHLRGDYSPYQCHVSFNREDYGWHARRVHLVNLLKTWANTGKNPLLQPVECKECLYNTRVPSIYIGTSGLCNMCMTYRRNFRPEILESELQVFLNTKRESGANYDAAVAFSGGKDSSAALYLATRRFHLKVVAVMVDNGFIPELVMTNAQRWCDKLGVERVILNLDFAPRLKQMMEHGFKRSYPCYECGRLFHEAILRYCGRNRINRLISGDNWWRWLEPEVRSVQWVRDEESGLAIQFIALPFASRLTERSLKALLEAEGWSAVQLHGNSTNCLIPGLVEHVFYRRLGYHPELNLASREVITGYLKKEEARESLQDIQDLSPALREILRAKLDSAGIRQATPVATR